MRTRTVTERIGETNGKTPSPEAIRTYIRTQWPDLSASDVEQIAGEF